MSEHLRDEEVTLLAETDFRGAHRRFGIKKKDRRLHTYILGKTGMGKTTLILNMLLRDIARGEGVCFLDPHGDAVETLLDYVPSSRVEDVIYVNPADLEYPVALNILERVSPEQTHLLVSNLNSIFQKLYPEHWHHRQQHILRNTLLALLEREETPTLLDVYWLLSDATYRERVVKEVKDPIVRSFWKHEFPTYLYQAKGEPLAPVLNKLGMFLTSSLVRNIVGQRRNAIDFRRAMDTGKILLANLSKGRIGEDTSSFFGFLFATAIYLAAMSRIDVPQTQRRDFYLYVDEFQNFVATETFDSILSEARKYRLNLILAHQYIGQLSEGVRKAILGNVGTTIVFPVGAENGESLETEFSPEFTRQDLVRQPARHIYLKLAMDGSASRPFSARTLDPFSTFRSQRNKARLIALSRKRYATPRDTVERHMRTRHPHEPPRPSNLSFLP
ncbi:MAG: type IV secretory system conjugative DNA transfer family protein [Candidatus Methylomirabilales bacterium]